MTILCLGLKVPRGFPKEQCVHFPVIATEMLGTVETSFFLTLHTFSHLLFTSQQAVFYFAKTLFQLKIPLSALEALKIIAVGPSTAKEVQALLGQKARYPSLFSQEGLMALFEKENVVSLLFPKAQATRDLLEKFFIKRRISYAAIPLYHTLVLVHKELPSLEGVEKIYFSSPSTVRGFFANYKQMPKDKTLLFVGEVTAKAFAKKDPTSFQMCKKCLLSTDGDKIDFEALI